MPSQKPILHLLAGSEDEASRMSHHFANLSCFQSMQTHIENVVIKPQYSPVVVMSGLACFERLQSIAQIPNLRKGLCIDSIQDDTCLCVGNLKPEFVLIMKDFRRERSLFTRAVRESRMFYSDGLHRSIVDRAPYKRSMSESGITSCMHRALSAYLETGSVNEAARHLGLKADTVKEHLGIIRKKLKVKSNSQASFLFAKYGWISEINPPLQSRRIPE